MIIHQYLKKGSSHDNFCEDYVFNFEIANKYLVTCVFDGCSSGTESYFASALFGKAIKNYAKILNVDDFKTSEEIIKHLIFRTVVNIKSLAESLFLNTDELLSTLIILVADLQKKTGNILCLGDGFISINGTNYVIEQDNRPDYIAYHFQEFNDNITFENWYNSQLNKFEFTEIKNITISTDGISSFVYESPSDVEIDVIEFLTKDLDLIRNKSMLGRKVNILKNKHKLINYDDLGIIRIVEV